MSIWQMLWIAAWLLLATGIYGLVTGRNLLKLMIALQLMVKGALLLIVTAAALHGRAQLGTSLAVTVIAVDTLTTVIGLALVVQIKARLGTLSLDELGRIGD